MTFSLKNIFLGVGAIVIGSLAVYVMSQSAFGASFPDPRTSNPAVASSTAYTVAYGVSATRLVATSTPPGTRVALTVQTTNCTPGSVFYLNHNDVVSATGTGMALLASSTMTYGDSVPIVPGTVRGFSSGGTCSVLVTEFRTSI